MIILSCECKCKFESRKCNSNQNWNNDKCWRECNYLKKHHVCKKDYILSPAICSCEYGKYVASAIDDSVITCDETINASDSAPTNFEIIRCFLVNQVLKKAQNCIFSEKTFYNLDKLAFWNIILSIE